ncbi:MAG TPA: FAD-dependent oxidoreductase [Candidatus Xenobia bacterium]|jgi:NADPH-dependent 2,4-dienoyl-CoA reductase/sulfur reductase-like enzyme
MSIVIVGASLAGLRAAEAVRQAGFSGSLTVIGDEPYRPYDRVPLSKHVLSGRLPAEHCTLASLHPIDARWLLGRAVVGLDRRASQVVLGDGDRIGYRRMLIATGARARPWPGPVPPQVVTLRSLDDASALRALLPSCRRLVVVGGGVMGCEIASRAVEMGVRTTLVERSATPMGALGRPIGHLLAQRMSTQVDMRLSNRVVEWMVKDGHLAGARLENEVVEADVAVLALGVLRNVEWLHGSGLPDAVCDEYCRVLGPDGDPQDDILAAGDVTGAAEHWGHAVAQAAVAGANLVHPRSQVYHPFSTWWTSQFGLSLKVVGSPQQATEVVLAQGSLEEYRFIALYGRAGKTVAVLSCNHARWLPFYEALLGTPFPPPGGGPERPEVMTAL